MAPINARPLPLMPLTDDSVRMQTDMIVDDAYDTFFGEPIAHMNYERFMQWIAARQFVIDAVFRAPLAHIMPRTLEPRPVSVLSMPPSPVPDRPDTPVMDIARIGSPMPVQVRVER